DRKRPARSEPLDRLPRTRQQRKPLAVEPLEPADDLVGDLLWRQVDAEVIVHVPRPLDRAHPHHVPLRPRVPPAAKLPRQLLASGIPDLLVADQHAVEIEDDSPDHSGRYAWPMWTRGGPPVPRSAAVTSPTKSV